MLKNKLKYSLFCFLSLLLFACSQTARIASVETEVIELNINNTPSEDAAVINLIAPYKAEFDKEMNDVLGYSGQEMVKGYPEGLLGNFVADLILKKANEYRNSTNKPGKKGIDICLLNYGGLRTDIPKGKITRSRVFELMPFENRIVVITLSGEKTKNLFDFVARIDGYPISGVKFGIKKNAAVNIMIQGEPFDIKKNYRVVTSDYLAYGGDKMSFFSNPIHIDILKHKIRDAIIEFVVEENQKGNVLKAQLDGRIYYVE